VHSQLQHGIAWTATTSGCGSIIHSCLHLSCSTGPSNDPSSHTAQHAFSIMCHGDSHCTQQRVAEACSKPALLLFQEKLNQHTAQLLQWCHSPCWCRWPTCMLCPQHFYSVMGHHMLRTHNHKEAAPHVSNMRSSRASVCWFAGRQQITGCDDTKAPCRTRAGVPVHCA
jgi:hypothetical protein